MKNDPIVEEIHEVRERLAKAFDYDIAQIFKDIRSREHLLGDRLKNRQKSLEKPVPPNSGNQNTLINQKTPTAG